MRKSLNLASLVTKGHFQYQECVISNCSISHSNSQTAQIIAKLLVALHKLLFRLYSWKEHLNNSQNMNNLAGAYLELSPLWTS